jgi:hypothetical protein
MELFIIQVSTIPLLSVFQVLLSTLFRNTSSLLVLSLRLRDRVSHPYKTGKFIIVFISMFGFLDGTQELLN